MGQISLRRMEMSNEPRPSLQDLLREILPQEINSDDIDPIIRERIKKIESEYLKSFNFNGEKTPR